ncbi:Malate dehydrogenase [Tritrichomonas foetus]|uniref:malate dehydrogenase n=1 Tax=Tritrichomonas foetus TaxID=1144522 RepID=A0A1J4KDP9_9EUKA|nr:malate dehydrogenase [Tritrichomonas foetus]OHT09323.1 Malate dehydrogenase [Tritrichomonas foetus]|eukprot:OHT09323.1 Malate dehydrogenase [Tritrichomonas foetus]
MCEEPANVVITGAAGQIGYVLAFRIANGDLYPNRKVRLHLLEITPVLPKLEGVKMELQDCAFPKLAGVEATDDPNVAFKDADVVFLVGSFPRKDGMDRADLLSKNGGIFKEQGLALNNARPTVKVIVVGNPANTNCAIALHFANKLGPQNFCAMTRLDHNRMKGELAEKAGVPYSNVHRVTVWGNHSNTQVPDVSHAEIEYANGVKPVTAVFEKSYYEGDFVSKIATRGGAVIKARGASSAASAANAAIACMHDWINGTRYGDWVSMAIPVPESKPYGIETGVVYSFPCTVDAQGNYHVVEGLEINDFVREKMQVTLKELQEEKATAWKALGL